MSEEAQHPEPAHPREIQWALSDLVDSADLHPLVAGLMLELPRFAARAPMTDTRARKGGVRAEWLESRRDAWLRALCTALDLLFVVVPDNPDDEEMPWLLVDRIAAVGQSDLGLPRGFDPLPDSRERVPQLPAGADANERHVAYWRDLALRREQEIVELRARDANAPGANDEAWRTIRDDLQVQVESRDNLIEGLRGDANKAIASNQELRNENAALKATVRELETRISELERALPDDGAAEADAAELRDTPEHRALLEQAAEIAGEPEANPWVRRGEVESKTGAFGVEARPCKVDDCEGHGPRYGAWAGICADDEEHLRAGGSVLIGGVEHHWIETSKNVGKIRPTADTVSGGA